MAHYAQIDNNNRVKRVIVANKEFIDSGKMGDPSKWIQTSYNTSGGEHSLGGTQFRKNYAGVGSTYDTTRDAFISPQPYTSWILNETTCQWDAPIPMPTDNNYYWDEETTNWIVIGN